MVNRQKETEFNQIIKLNTDHAGDKTETSRNP